MNSLFLRIIKLIFCLVTFASAASEISQGNKYMNIETNNIPEGNWSVTDGNITCLRADMKIKFSIYHESKWYRFPLSPTASSSLSNCNLTNITQILVLSDTAYTLAFEFEKDSKSTYVRNISLVYRYSSEATEEYFNDTKLFPVNTGNSYLCRSNDLISMRNATMEILDIHLQAFGKEGDHDFNTAEECIADDTVGDVFVISFACGLSALIILVLIIYLVGRRRSRRQMEYTSV